MFITSIIHDCCVENKKTSKIHIFKKSHFHSIHSKFYFGNTKLIDPIIVPRNTNSNVTIITKIINIYHLLCSIWPLRGVWCILIGLPTFFNKLDFILYFNVTCNFNKCISHDELSKFWPFPSKCAYQGIWNQQKKEKFELFTIILNSILFIFHVAPHFKHNDTHIMMSKFPTSIKN